MHRVVAVGKRSKGVGRGRQRRGGGAGRCLRDSRTRIEPAGNQVSIIIEYFIERTYHDVGGRVCEVLREEETGNALSVVWRLVSVVSCALEGQK